MPNFGVTKGVTTNSSSVYHLWQGFSVGAAIIGAFVLALIAYAVVRYRRKGDVIPAQTQYHLPLELVYTIVPIIIVFALFGATLVVENKVVANPKTSVVVDVNAFQWGWKFAYPGSSAVVVGQTTQDPVMEIPVNTDVHINLTSTDVIHGFYVKEFNFSRYALPGVVNQFTIRAVNTGTFFGQCTQLCGLYHSLMFFKVKVVTMDQYTAWLNSFQNTAAAQISQTATQQQTASHVQSKITASSGAN